MDTESTEPYLWMLCGSFSFALMGALAHVLATSCDWRVIALVRAIIPLLVTLSLAQIAGVPLVLWRPRELWMRSLAGSTAMLCTFFALSRLPAHVVLAITNTFPIWVTLLSWPVVGERPPRAVWLAVFSGVAGVILIQRPFAHGLEDARNLAALVALAGTLFTAIAMLGLHRLKGIDTRAIIVHFSVVALLFSSGSIFLTGQPEVLGDLLHTQHVGMLLLVGLVATLGQFFLTRAYATGSPSRVSVIALTQILFALGLDWLLGERGFHATTFVGVVLVIIPSGWLLLWRGRRKEKVATDKDR